MGRIRSLTHMSLDGLKSSRNDNPAAAVGETAKGHPGVGECCQCLIEGIPGDLRVDVIGAEGGSNLAPGQYRGHEEYTGDHRDCGPPRRLALSAPQ